MEAEDAAKSNGRSIGITLRLVFDEICNGDREKILNIMEMDVAMLLMRDYCGV